MATIQVHASLPFLSLGEDTSRLNPLQSTSPAKDKSVQLAKPNRQIREKYKSIIIMHNKVHKRLNYFQRIICSYTHNSSDPTKHTTKEDNIRQNSMEIMENMVLNIKEREEAIQLLVMDPQVCSKLLTHHRKAARLMQKPFVPPPVEYRKRPPDGIAKEQKLVVAEKLFRVALQGFLNI